MWYLSNGSCKNNAAGTRPLFVKNLYVTNTRKNYGPNKGRTDTRRNFVTKFSA